jgi:riboflavin synthase
MFTGLIEAVGRVERNDPAGSGRRLRIAAPLATELAPGDSVAVNGVCLTVAAHDAEGFDADLAPETLRVTTLGMLVPGVRVNLERPLRADSRVGGHFVQGHVDGVASVVANRLDGDCRWLELDLPAPLAPLVIAKGSIALDGVSLTVAALEGARVAVQIVPYTLAHTALGDRRPGDPLNVEADMLGKYVRRLLGDRPDLAAVMPAGPRS